MGIQRIKPTPPFPCPHLAIPAQSLPLAGTGAGIQHNKRALRAPSGRSEDAADSDKLAPPPAAAIVRMCAFRALFARDSGFRRNDRKNRNDGKKQEWGSDAQEWRGGNLFP